jgi:hypothetical protein
MIEGLPVYISVLFILITLVTLFIMYKASGNSKLCLLLGVGWLTLQAILCFNGFYTVTDTLPPRPMLMVGPPMLAIIIIFATRGGRKFVDGFNATTLTWLHTIRIPVEIVLFMLAAENVIPEVMTFEGRNFDIISGITAPFIAWYGMKKKSISPTLLLIWNFLCIGLLINVVAHGLFSIPSTIQQFEFEVPNVGLLFFPFNWLPAFVVPVVFFSHFVSIRKIIKRSY